MKKKRRLDEERKREEFEAENRRKEEENRKRYEDYMRFQQQEQEKKRLQDEQMRQNEYFKQMEIQRQNLINQQQQQLQQQQQQQQQQLQQMYTTMYQPVTTTTTYVQPQPQPQVTVTKTVKTETKRSKYPITRLIITVIRCRRLSKHDTFTKSDPYVVLMHNQIRHKTTWLKNTQNPVYNQDFEFRGVLEFDEIVLNVFDHTLTGKDHFQGEIRLNKKDFINGSESWFPLQSRQGRYDRISGDVLLRFTLHYT